MIDSIECPNLIPHGGAVQTAMAEAFFRSHLKVEGRSNAHDAAAYSRYKVAPGAHEITMALRGGQRGPERRSLSALTGAAGAFSVPEQFSDTWEIAKTAASIMRQVCSLQILERGSNYRLPTCDDTVNEGELMSENRDGTSQDVAWGQRLFTCWKVGSKRVRVPNELATDSPRFAEQLTALLASRCGRYANRLWTVGTGISQPLGIVNSAAAVTAASSSAIAGDDIFGLIDAVGDAYADPATSSFMCHRDILALVRKLKDGSGRYLWEPSANKLAGYTLHLNHHMDSTCASGNNILLFGQFDKYLITEAGTVRIQAFQESSGVAEADQTQFRSVQRVDGQLVDEGQHPIAVLRN